MTGRFIFLRFCLIFHLSCSAFHVVSAQENGAPPLQQPAEKKSEVEPERSTDNTSKSNAGATADDAAPRVINSAANDYVLTTADTLEMAIFHEPDLGTRTKVGSDGSVQLPLVGDVKVAGMTVRDARELIRKLYDAKYLVKPQVYLNVVDYAQKKFTILGQVTKPGTYELPGGSTLTLLEAVGIAGGFTRSADRGKVTVQRTTKAAGRSTIKINAKKLSGEGENSFNILPGDVISVAESWF